MKKTKKLSHALSLELIAICKSPASILLIIENSEFDPIICEEGMVHLPEDEIIKLLIRLRRINPNYSKNDENTIFETLTLTAKKVIKKQNQISKTDILNQPKTKSPFDISEDTLRHGYDCDDPECGGDGH